MGHVAMECHDKCYIALVSLDICLENQVTQLEDKK